MPGQHSALHRHIIAPEGRIFFAGEHASLTHTWFKALSSRRCGPCARCCKKSCVASKQLTSPSTQERADVAFIYAILA
jgi:hypothetical protein